MGWIIFQKADVEKWKAEENERIGVTLGGTMFSHGEGGIFVTQVCRWRKYLRQEWSVGHYRVQMPSVTEEAEKSSPLAGDY